MKYRYDSIKIKEYWDYLFAIDDGYCVFDVPPKVSKEIIDDAYLRQDDSDKAMYVYASLLRDDFDSIPDGKKVYFSIMKKLADKGYVLAYHDLGVAYGFGTGTPIDYEKSLYWANKAIEAGLLISENRIAVAKYTGKGMAKDLPAAVESFKKLAKLGYRVAQRNIALCYERGVIVKQSREEAFKWYLKAAEQGDATAMYNVAVYYLNGYGGAEELYSEARYWAMKALSYKYDESKKIIDFLVATSCLEEKAKLWYEVDNDLFND